MASNVTQTTSSSLLENTVDSLPATSLPEKTKPVYVFPEVSYDDYVLWSEDDDESSPPEDYENTRKTMASVIIERTKIPSLYEENISYGIRSISAICPFEDIRIPSSALKGIKRLKHMKEGFIGNAGSGGWTGDIGNYPVLVPCTEYSDDEIKKAKYSPGVIVLESTAWLRERNLVPALAIISKAIHERRHLRIYTQVQARSIIERFLERIQKEEKLTHDFLLLVEDSLLVLLLVKDELLNDSEPLLYFMKYGSLYKGKDETVARDLSLYLNSRKKKVVAKVYEEKMTETKRDKILDEVLTGEYFVHLTRIKEEIRRHNIACIRACY